MALSFLFLLSSSLHFSYAGKVCSYLAIDGIGYPVDTCMYQADDEAEFAFRFTCHGKDISQQFWEDTRECAGHSDLRMDDYYCASPADLSGQECDCIGRGPACDTFTMEQLTGVTCEKTGASKKEIVVNTCVKTGYGGSAYFGCDADTLSMWSYTDCDDCNCSPTREVYDYQYLNDDCFQISCAEGSRRVVECDERGSRAKSLEGKEFLLSQHIQMHHVFVHDIISKHYMKPLIDNRWDIFGKDSIFAHHKLLAGLSAIVILIAFVGMASLCKNTQRNSEYTKI